MIITKADVGKEVVLIPTGNNISRAKSSGNTWQQVRTALITKVNNKGGALRINDRNETKFTFHPHVEDFIVTGLNAGYQVFESEKALDDYKKAKRIRQYLQSHVTIPTEQLLKIGEILGNDFDE